MDIQTEIKTQEAVYEASLRELKDQFKQYQEEFYKLQSVSSALELECKQLQSKNDLYRSLLLETIKRVESGDIKGLQSLYAGVIV